jgi:3-dehydroquinate synthase class II
MQLLMVTQTAEGAKTLLGALETGVDGIVLDSNNLAEVPHPVSMSFQRHAATL